MLQGGKGNPICDIRHVHANNCKAHKPFHMRIRILNHHIKNFSGIIHIQHKLSRVIVILLAKSVGLDNQTYILLLFSDHKDRQRQFSTTIYTISQILIGFAYAAMQWHLILGRLSDKACHMSTHIPASRWNILAFKVNYILVGMFC